MHLKEDKLNILLYANVLMITVTTSYLQGISSQISTERKSLHINIINDNLFYGTIISIVMISVYIDIIYIFSPWWFAIVTNVSIGHLALESDLI